MQELKRTELAVRAERALLVSVLLPDSKADPSDPVGELRSLARTAGALVVDEMCAKRRGIDPALYVGSGKAEEIASRAQMNDIDVIIFDNDLSPAQIRDLEKITARKVLDRSELILDIFASHARTAESRLQVELAQLEYTYPRLHHMWSHLERVAGGASSAAAAVGGIGTRGPGEKQLEIDRRLVQKRVNYLKRQIHEIDRRKVRQVRSRKDVFSVCLVGYTNAGKSTLMRLLTGADVLVADRLFATLDTKTRRWSLGDGQEVLLSDTVGFVRDLPHHLVASFRATLEEAIHGDLLLHVADASSDRVEHQVQAVHDVLDEIGCDRDKELLVLNKIDRINDPTTFTLLRRRYGEALLLSAATGQGADALVEAVLHRSTGVQVRVKLEVNCGNGRAMQFIARHARIESQEFADSTARIEAVIARKHLDHLKTLAPDVRVIS
ncbi:MAG: GTPase HflX [Planctomycetes bacterium ADurb.Bin126]|nr:MAG: GTPase HflX [Planctomycetes bacterium ADurb.Bin126]HOD79929.1 GTPase HflX [Phycisphaerae bacterium]HQL73256.1 GTPase HflX [Phycisphaerae bacterium]